MTHQESAIGHCIHVLQTIRYKLERDYREVDTMRNFSDSDFHAMLPLALTAAG